ncbi:MAG: hypothetical protein O7I42_03935, partial [Alphaproteobacteria bacterium]|nr:hypothetical protein [Alphaproteobacteria bacterium]
NLKDALRKINAYRDNFVHGRLLYPRGSSKPQLWHIAMPAGGSRPLHHKRTLGSALGMSALLPKADIKGAQTIRYPVSIFGD